MWLSGYEFASYLPPPKFLGVHVKSLLKLKGGGEGRGIDEISNFRWK